MLKILIFCVSINAYEIPGGKIYLATVQYAVENNKDQEGEVKCN